MVLQFIKGSNRTWGKQVFIRSFFVIGFCFLLISSTAGETKINHSLKFELYTGKPINMPLEAYTIHGELVSEAPPIGYTMDYSAFPVLIGFNLSLLKEYAFTLGYFSQSEQGFGMSSGERIAFSDMLILGTPMIKAVFWDYVRPPHQPEATAYYPHNGTQSTASFIFPFLSIFKGHRAPYYQEITQRAKPTHNLFPHQKGNQPMIKGENITFYHLDRNDGYIETYGFRKPRGNEIKDVEQILVLQAVYPAAQMEAFKAPLTQLFIQEVQQHKSIWGY